MQRTHQTLFFLVISTLLIICANCFADDYEEGRFLANRGSFARARALWEPLANRGDARAQYGLARMYARGDGVTRDFTKAANLARDAAEQGNKEAQLMLAKMYRRGDGVVKSTVEAERWEKGNISRAVPTPLTNRSFEVTPSVERFATPFPTATFPPAGAIDQPASHSIADDFHASALIEPTVTAIGLPRGEPAVINPTSPPLKAEELSSTSQSIADDFAAPADATPSVITTP